MVNVPDSVIRIGRRNRLRVVTLVTFGVYLDGKNYDEILLPQRYVPEGCQVDDFLDVFVYSDSEDRLVATTETPYGMVGELAFLKVVDETPVGAFVDWGLSKDLLIPFREQKERLCEGESTIVYIYFDKASERIVGSTKLHKHINPKSIQYTVGDEVDLVIGNAFGIGYNVIIDKRFVGVIFRNEVFQPIEEGQSLKGFIKQVRPDGKIDVELQKSGSFGKADLSKNIMEQLKAAGGFLPLTDKSPPETIYERFKVSKKAYKRAVGGLYKKRLLTIEDDGIRLN